VLSAYAGELLKRLPKTATGGTSAQPPYHGSDWHVRLPQEEEEVLAAILATAEYCRCAGLEAAHLVEHVSHHNTNHLVCCELLRL
jgi:hypothetical protein